MFRVWYLFLFLINCNWWQDLGTLLQSRNNGTIFTMEDTWFTTTQKSLSTEDYFDCFLWLQRCCSSWECSKRTDHNKGIQYSFSYAICKMLYEEIEQSLRSLVLGNCITIKHQPFWPVFCSGFGQTWYPSCFSAPSPPIHWT